MARGKQPAIKVEIKPEERDLDEIIKVFQANIKYYPGYGNWKPSVCFTQGQMAYIVELLETVKKETHE